MHIAQNAQQAERPTMRQIGWAGLVAVVGAGVATALVSTLARLLVPETVGFLPLQLGPTLFFTVGGVLGATLVFLLLTRLTRQPVRAFYLVAAVVLALSFLPDLGLLTTPLPGSDAATPLTVGILMLEHVLVAVVSVGVLTTRG